jgi:hypothetical protein
MRRPIEALIRGGVKIIAGTDVPVMPLVPGFALHHELAALVDAGLTPMQAIQAATRNASQAAGRSDQVGTIEPGKRADLVSSTPIRWQTSRTQSGFARLSPGAGCSSGPPWTACSRDAAVPLSSGLSLGPRRVGIIGMVPASRGRSSAVGEGTSFRWPLEVWSWRGAVHDDLGAGDQTVTPEPAAEQDIGRAPLDGPDFGLPALVPDLQVDPGVRVHPFQLDDLPLELHRRVLVKLGAEGVVRGQPCRGRRESEPSDERQRAGLHPSRGLHGLFPVLRRSSSRAPLRMLDRA